MNQTSWPITTTIVSNESKIWTNETVKNRHKDEVSSLLVKPKKKKNKPKEREIIWINN